MKNLFKALSEFQTEVPVIHQETKGYGYTYANLTTIFEVINPLLKKHGLGFTQLIMGDCVKTVIFHIESGETIESLTEIPKDVQLKGMNQFQVLGSAITYIRRYSLSAALGLVTDKDIDAQGEQVNKVNPEHEGKPVFTVNSKAWHTAIKKKLSIPQIEEHYSVAPEVADKYLASL